MPMMKPQILKSVDFTITQKSRCLEKKTYFLKTKKNNNTSKISIAKNSFVADVTFKN